ncbi:uncharacterized protein KQ657_000360 [Scheffersomyces spartinae]|uniref:Glutathione synthetase n=1 Tax=Scheffersomyces spartinae TaxID=45513 RepID=A0A9P7VA71_9ASCO|nr:uncharacterized protein KQ657_000360 [Scheffersomyces spartinae]KAG7193673.1 hypothetical protein KQ657_000360 [Scheffersomyces spartinae]
MSFKSFPQLSEDQETQLQEKLCHWSLANGLIMYPPQFKSFSSNVAPITLYPTPFPKAAFEDAVKVETVFHELYINAIANNKEWLKEILQDLSKHDKDFTGKLYETYTKALELNGGKILQPLSLGLFRSDYMLDNDRIKQVEFNTISVSFGGLSTKVGQLHDFLNKSGAYDSKYSYEYYDRGEVGVSDSVNKLAEGLADGDKFYSQQQGNSKNGVVLFIVQNGERNVFDQKHVEFALLNNHGIKSIRMSLEEVQFLTTVRDNKLYIKQSMDEVSVVYYRSAYSPNDYASNPDLTWGARLYLENTLAIKCPSVLTQLSGAKKIQQILSTKDVINTIAPSIEGEDLKRLVSTFVGILPLDDTDEGKAAIELAFKEPHRFVLKPQREGGGNNIYKEDIPDFLNSIDKEEWGGYILMELINAPTHKSKIIRNDELIHEDIISELGIFGTTVFNEDTGETLSNKYAGHLLRSKVSSSNEGGVAAGFGCVDNIYLY